MELYATILATLSFLIALFTYFGMHPRRIQLVAISFVKFMQRHPRIIVIVLFTLILVNLIVVAFRIGYFSGMLIGVISAITGALIALLGEFLIMRLTIGKEVASKDTQLLAVMASRFHGVSELPNNAKIVTTFGAHAQWLQTALETYGVSFVAINLSPLDTLDALRRGMVDAALVRGHPLPVLKEPIKLGTLRLLPWSKQAVEAVTNVFPAATRPSKLPANTYEGQAEEIQGYAPY